MNPIALLPPPLRAVAETFDASSASGQPRKFGSNGLKVDGKLFALFTQGTLVVKLPKERVAALVAKGDGKPFERMPMKDSLGPPSVQDGAPQRNDLRGLHVCRFSRRRLNQSTHVFHIAIVNRTSQGDGC
jgi:hypothetical protein